MVALSIFVNVGLVLAQSEASKPVAEGSTTIVGRAICKDGTPVQNATIGIFSFNAFEGILPVPAHTKGTVNMYLFTLAMVMVFISVSKPEEATLI